MRLFDIADEYLSLLQFAEDGEVDEEIFNNTLESIQGELYDKADAYAKIDVILKKDEDVLDEEIKRLTERKKRISGRRKKLKENLKSCMIATGEVKFSTPFHTFWVQNNPKRLQVDSDALIPNEFWMLPEPIINNDAIRTALDNGVELPFARYEQGCSLRIK